MKRKRIARGRTGTRNSAGIEWIGGMAAMPAYITGEGEPYRPSGLLWLGADGEIVGFTVAKPGELLAIASDTLQSAMGEPMYGRPYRPTRVRVASTELAEALRAGHPDLDVVCAPTPELDEILAQLQEKKAEESSAEPSSLTPEIPPDAMASFFKAAAALYRAQPGQLAAERAPRICRFPFVLIPAPNGCSRFAGSQPEVDTCKHE